MFQYVYIRIAVRSYHAIRVFSFLYTLAPLVRDFSQRENRSFFFVFWQRFYFDLYGVHVFHITYNVLV